MMEYVLAQLQQAQYGSVSLWVFVDNIRARKFYEKHGFTPTGLKKQVKDTVEIMYRKEL